MMLFQCSWTTVTLISACKELMLDVFSSIGEDVMVGVGCTARRDARNSDLLKIDEIDPTYAWLDPAPVVRGWSVRWTRRWVLGSRRLQRRALPLPTASGDSFLHQLLTRTNTHHSPNYDVSK